MNMKARGNHNVNSILLLQFSLNLISVRLSFTSLVNLEVEIGMNMLV